AAARGTLGASAGMAGGPLFGEIMGHGNSRWGRKRSDGGLCGKSAGEGRAPRKTFRAEDGSKPQKDVSRGGRVEAEKRRFTRRAPRIRGGTQRTSLRSSAKTWRPPREKSDPGFGRLPGQVR